MHLDGSTVCALATAAGGALALIRVSGPDAFGILARIFKSKDFPAKAPARGIYYGRIADERGDIDEVLVLLMPAPRSYTGEDVAEISCHGGASGARRILSALIKSGARPAGPGEFTKRAFLNGRLDLSGAEAVIDMINAGGQAAQSMALGQLGGFVRERVTALRTELAQIFGNIEVCLDYPEHDLEEITCDAARKAALDIMSEIDGLIKGSGAGELIKNGVDTAIIGRPNAGKSSLLNALARRERAIVAETPGTTRDIVSEYVELENGLALRLCDTAGIREAESGVEKIGVGLSLSAAAAARLVLAVFDGSEPLAAEDRRVLGLLEGKTALILINKLDKGALLDEKDFAEYPFPVLSVSAKTGRGLEKLPGAISDLLFSDDIDFENPRLVSNLRHKNALSRARDSAALAVETLENDFGADLAAIDLENAYRFLGEITGETAGDDVIDRIFKDFCVGK